MMTDPVVFHVQRRLGTNQRPDVLTINSENATTTFVPLAATMSPSVIDSSDSNRHALDQDNVWPYALATVFLLFICYCIKPHIPDDRFIRRIRSEQYVSVRERSRQELLDNLIVQTVVSADDAGNLQLGAAVTNPLSVSEASNNNNDNRSCASYSSNNRMMQLSLSSVSSKNRKLLMKQPPPPPAATAKAAAAADDDSAKIACCCICLEPYQVGDVVAWSRHSSETCRHVWHQDCIFEWLLSGKHDDCPSCRTTLILGTTTDGENNIPADDENRNGDDGDVEEGHPSGMEGGSEHHSYSSNNTTHTPFVIVQGLISRARRASSNWIGRNIHTFGDNNKDIIGDVDMPPGPTNVRRVLSFGDGLRNRNNHPKNTAAERWIPLSITSSTDSGDGPGAATSASAPDTILRTTRLDETHMCVPLRRVVSAGPASPVRPIRSDRAHHKKKHPPEGTDAGGAFDVAASNKQSMHQHQITSILRRHFEDEEEDDFLAVLPHRTNSVVRSGVSWAHDIDGIHYDNDDDTITDHVDDEEDEIIIPKKQAFV